MAVIYRVFTEKLGASSTSAFIGNFGDLFYDPTTVSLRISDGATAGGVPISAGAVAPPAATAITYAAGAGSTLTATTIQAAIDELSTTKLSLTGGTMTGELVLSNVAPTSPDAAVSKSFVEGLIANGGVTSNTVVFDNSTVTTVLSANTVQAALVELAMDKMDKSGDTMTGFLTLSGDPTSNLHAATKGYVDTTVASLVNSAPAALDTLNELAAALGNDANFATTVTTAITGKLSLTGGTLTGDLLLAADPTLALGAATKQYVDSKIASGVSSNTVVFTSNTSNLTSNTVQDAIIELALEKVAIGGDTMTGFLTLSADPTANLHAATKAYVDSKVTTTTISSNNITFTPAGTLAANTVTAALAELDAEKVAKAGDTMTGALILFANPTANLEAVTKQYVDTSIATVVSGGVTANNIVFTPAGNITSTSIAGAVAELDAEKVAKTGDTMTGLLTLSADPTANLHAVTKQYLDTAVANVVSGSVKVMNDLTDVAITSFTAGNILSINGAGKVTATPLPLNALSDVSKTTPVSGQVLSYDFATSTWMPITLPPGTADTYTANATINSSGVMTYTKNDLGTYSVDISTAVVMKTGSTMTGLLTLSSDPTANLHAATKQYVDIKVSTTGGNNVSFTTNTVNLTSNTVQNAINELSAKKVAVGGDTMTGLLTLSADPTNALHAATKQYVDTKVSSGVTSNNVSFVTNNSVVSANTVQAAINELAVEKVTLAGDTMTGFLTLNAAPTANLHAATKLYVDTAVSAGVNANTIAFVSNNSNLSANSIATAINELAGDKVALAGDTMTGLLTLSGAPTANLHAATKAYVDSKTTALDSNTIVFVSNNSVVTANTVQDALNELALEKVALAGDTMTGLLTLSGAPTSDLHAATKKYVDDATYTFSAGTTAPAIGTEASGDLWYNTSVGNTGLWTYTSNTWNKSWQGTGDVVGPASASNNAIARFDSTTGKLIKSSLTSISDTGLLYANGFMTDTAGITVIGPYKTGSSTSLGTLDWSAKSYYKMNISTAVTVNFTNVHPSYVNSMTVEIYMNGGSITWPSTVRWAANTTPTLTNAKTHLVMFTSSNGGSTVLGSALTDYA